MNQSRHFINLIDVSYYINLIDEGKPFTALNGFIEVANKLESSIHKQACEFYFHYADIYNNSKDNKENDVRRQLDKILSDFIQFIIHTHQLQTKYESYAPDEKDLLSLIQYSPIPILVSLTEYRWPDFDIITPVIRLNECTEGKFKSYYKHSDEVPEICRKYQIDTFPSYHIFFRGELLSSAEAGIKKQVLLALWYDEIVNKVDKARNLVKNKVIMSADQRELVRTKFSEDFVRIQQIAIDFEKDLDNRITCGTKAQIDAWLHKRPFLFDCFENDGFIFPNFKFGENFEADFVQFTPSISNDTPEINVNLIISNSCFSALYTDTDELSPELVKSIETTNAWKGWVMEHLDVFKTELNELYKRNEPELWTANPDFEMSRLVLEYSFKFDLNVKYKIIIGRKSYLTEEQKRNLRYRSGFLIPTSIVTYDNLIIGWHNRTCYVPKVEIH